MEITLVKTEETQFKIDESKCKAWDLEDIMMIAKAEYKPVAHEGQRYVAFKTRDEFFENINNYDIDTTKKILVNSKGYFFCPIKSAVTIIESQENTTADEPTNSEENKAE